VLQFFINKLNPCRTTIFSKEYTGSLANSHGKVTLWRYCQSAGNSSICMVGWAMNASHGKDEVPAHRVVNRNGLLTEIPF
jgi:methylated-DNA-protein-cysteine methyltransferase-like protein